MGSLCSQQEIQEYYNSIDCNTLFESKCCYVEDNNSDSSLLNKIWAQTIDKLVKYWQIWKIKLTENRPESSILSSWWIKCCWLNPELSTIKEQIHARVSRKRTALEIESLGSKICKVKDHFSSNKNSSDDTNYSTNYKDTNSLKLIKRFSKEIHNLDLMSEIIGNIVIEVTNDTDAIKKLPTNSGLLELKSIQLKATNHINQLNGAFKRIKLEWDKEWYRNSNC